MVERCISEMASSSLRNPILLLGVALGSRTNADHQPRVEDPLAIQGEKIIWPDIVDLQCPIQV